MARGSQSAVGRSALRVGPTRTPWRRCPVGRPGVACRGRPARLTWPVGTLSAPRPLPACTDWAVDPAIGSLRRSRRTPSRRHRCGRTSTRLRGARRTQRPSVVSGRRRLSELTQLPRRSVTTGRRASGCRGPAALACRASLARCRTALPDLPGGRTAMTGGRTALAGRRSAPTALGARSTGTEPLRSAGGPTGACSARAVGSASILRF